MSGAPLVVQLARRGKHWQGMPFFDRGRGVGIERDKRLREGVLALVRTTGRGQAKLVTVLGPAASASVVLEAFMVARGLRRRFDPAVAREAAKAAARGGHAVPARRDLTGLFTFTIDPATAKDFDDAISAVALGDGHWRIWVHIADVTAFVPPGSLVDREAYRRGTSVYVPGRVEPMLPEALSNEACSLVPHVDRLAVTVEMEVRGPQVVAADFYRSTIRSDQRWSYDDVDRLFGVDDVPEPLAVARAASAALGSARASRALAIDNAEPEFAFDARGNISALRPVPQTESHRLIEHLMIAANEQVAGLLEARAVPALYRVHERPSPAAVQRLAAQLASLDVPSVPVPEQLTADAAAEFAAELSRIVAQHVARLGHGGRGFGTLVLRSLKQAWYSASNLGHAGLGSNRYCHFTSPIRRYPDIVCHRGLLAAIGAGEEPYARARVAEAGEWTSARERDAMVIERDADDIARAFVLEQRVASADAEFDGEVVSLIGAGAFVAFGDGFEGLLPVRRLRGDRWELNELGTVLRGSESGRALRIGHPVRVTVGRIDAPRGRVDLYPAAL